MSIYIGNGILFIFLINLQNGQVSSQISKIDSSLASRMDTEKLNILVTFNNGVRSALNTVPLQKHADRGSRNTAIVSALKQNADTTQQDVIQMLSTRSNSGSFSYFRQYWTSNKLFVREADANTIKAIADNPHVKRIQLEPTLKIPEAKITHEVKEGTLPEPGWNIRRINTSLAWQELGGNKGDGVVVGIIDSGVQSSHDLLSANFRGSYGWYDGFNGTLEPNDWHGHGTACLSIMAGGQLSDTNDTIGVAPGVQWMACKGCAGGEPGDECKIEHVLNCIQFMSCPTLANGSNPDCSKAPHVLSFSLGGKREGEEFDDDFLTMKELGIISVASVGNKGSDCETSGSPANQPYVLGVGATYLDSFTGEDTLWLGGSQGPSPINGTIKPDLVAPGKDIFAATSSSESNSSLDIFVGTSFACPLVAGVVALLHVRNPNLTFEEAYKFVTETTSKDVKANGGCDMGSENGIPNNKIGYGLLNAFGAVKAQTAAMAGTKV